MALRQWQGPSLPFFAVLANNFTPAYFCGNVHCNMSIEDSESLNSSMGSKLGESVAPDIDDTSRFMGFLGRKVARELMNEDEVAGVLDDTGDINLEALIGMAVEKGIELSLRGTTSQEHVSAEATYWHELLPSPLLECLGHLILQAVPRGIEFQQTEISQGTDKYKSWEDEYQLFKALDSEQE